ncbi:MAG: DUF4097 family beta strand repeat-containing protein [bacterium]|nr:DUF4097 family beta strand repeat-containing protein [bacterium]
MHRKVSILVVFTLLLTLAGSLWAKSTVKEKFHQEVSGAGIAEFHLSNVNGSVDMEASSSDMVIIDAFKEVKGPDEDECQKILKELTIDVKNSENRISVKTKQMKNLFRYNYSVTYKVKVPARMRLEVGTTNGNVTCIKNEGGADIESTNGTLEFIECKGELFGGTTNGNIDVRNCSGKVEAETTNGSVIVKGDIRSVKSSTTNGNVEIDCNPDANGKVIAETTNGSIELSLPKTASAHVTAETSNGKIDVDGFTLQLNKKRTSAIGTIGSGTGKIELETTNGGIDIIAK